MAVFSAPISLLLLSLSVSSSSSVHGNTELVVDCSALIVNMMECLSFLTIGSTVVDKPQGSCCTDLKKILDNNAECLCEGLKKSSSMGIKLNATKVSTLPVLCKLNAPPVSSCGLSTSTPPASALGEEKKEIPFDHCDTNYTHECTWKFCWLYCIHHGRGAGDCVSPSPTDPEKCCCQSN